MNLKLVSAEWTGVHKKARKDVTYAVGQTTMAPDWDLAPECGGGIHYAEEPDDYMPDRVPNARLIEVEPVGETVRIDNGKSKAQGVCVIREITRIPTPEEEPDAEVRQRVAKCIPTERLDRLLTPAEEPDEGVRWRVAKCIPAERLDRLLTSGEELDEGVRHRVASRIPADRLDHLLTPDEEPDAWVRRMVALRIKNKS
ncbi:MAG: hypothetical protein ABIK13_00380 [Patescibacteria group bacterium]